MAALYAPRLVAEGLSFDGLTYACVARNMAEGVGSWWTPTYTALDSVWIAGNTTDVLYGQMPLFYWLQVPWFWILGNHWWVEKVYDTAVLIALLVLIAHTWRWQWAGSSVAAYGWLPVLLLCVCPDFRWTCTNHVIEPTLTLCCMASIGCILRAWRGNERWALAAGVGVVLSVLAKGPVGLFPLVAPLALCLSQGTHYPKALRLLAWMLLPLGLLALGVVFYAPARLFVLHFVEVQLLASLKGLRWESSVANQRWGYLHIAWALLYNLSNVGLVLLGFVLAFGIRPKRLVGAEARFWLLMGLAATLPFVLSPKQAAYYVVPALPCWVLGISSLIAPWIQAGVDRYWQQYGSLLARWWLFLGWCVAALVLGATLYRQGLTGKTPEQRQYIEAFAPVFSQMPNGETVAVPDRTWVLNPYLNTYLHRYHRIKLLADARRSVWWLAPPGQAPPSIVHYRQVCATPLLVLWKRNGT